MIHGTDSLRVRHLLSWVGRVKSEMSTSSKSRAPLVRVRILLKLAAVENNLPVRLLIFFELSKLWMSTHRCRCCCCCLSCFFGLFPPSFGPFRHFLGCNLLSESLVCGETSILICYVGNLVSKAPTIALRLAFRMVISPTFIRELDVPDAQIVLSCLVRAQ